MGKEFMIVLAKKRKLTDRLIKKYKVEDNENLFKLMKYYIVEEQIIESDNETNSESDNETNSESDNESNSESDNETEYEKRRRIKLEYEKELQDNIPCFDPLIELEEERREQSAKDEDIDIRNKSEESTNLSAKDEDININNK